MLYEDLVETSDQETAQEAVTNQLQNSSTLVIFTKADGTERTLIGTTSPKLIPEEALSDPSGDRPHNDDIQVVFDLEKMAWRSFRWDRLVSVDDYKS